MNQALSIFRNQKAMASTHTLPPSSSSFLLWRISGHNMETHPYPIFFFFFSQHWRHRRTCSLPSSAVTHWQKPDSCLPAVFISISSDSPLPDHGCVAPSRSLCWAQPPGSPRRLSPGCWWAEIVPRWEHPPSISKIRCVFEGEHPSAFLHTAPLYYGRDRGTETP